MVNLYDYVFYKLLMDLTLKNGTMKKKAFYVSPLVVVYPVDAAESFMAISVDGNIKDMEEEDGDY